MTRDEFIKYCRDGKYFRTFLDYANYYNISDDATSYKHKMYLFKLK